MDETIAHKHVSHACGDAGHHVKAANNLLVHLMLWHVTWQCWYSTHYKWPVLSQFSVKTAPDSTLGQQIFQLFLVHALRLPSKLANTLLNPHLISLNLLL